MSTRVEQGKRLIRAARSRAGRAKGKLAGTLGLTRPSLSVVVPVYNVEAFLAECLDSILGQSFGDFEVIVVDDGATDSSHEIAAAYASRDSRVKVIRQANAGLGAARNRGLAEARGEYVMFVESDDIVLDNAFRTLVETVRESGSDFVVGSFRRGTPERSSIHEWVRRTHDRRRIGIRVQDHEEILLDITAWNKVYRRSFLASIDFEYPTGVRYEDQYPSTRAFVLSDKFDVISDPVYLWRVRDDGTSITQQKSKMEDLVDRLDSIEQVKSFLAEHGDEQIRSYWLVKLLGYDFTGYYAASTMATPEWRERLHGFLTSLAPLVDATPDVWGRLHIKARTFGWLLVHGHVEEADRLLTLEQEASTTWLQPSDERPGFVLPGETSVPDELLAATRADFHPVVSLNDAVWDERTLVVSGLAALTTVHDAHEPAKLTVSLVHSRSGARVVCDALRTEVPDALRQMFRPLEDYTRSGFEVRFDEGLFAQLGTSNGNWRLEFEQAHPAGTVTSGVTRHVALSTFALREPRAIGPVMVSLAGNSARGVFIRVQEHWAIASSVIAEAGGLRLPLESREDDRVSAAETAQGASVSVQSDPHGQAMLLSRTAKLTPGPLRARLASGARVPIVAPLTFDAAVVGPGTVLHTGVSRELFLSDQPVLVVDSVEAAGDGVRIAGFLHGSTGVEVSLTGPRAATEGVRISSGGFDVEVSLMKDPWHTGPQALPKDIYELVCTGGVLLPAVQLRRQGRRTVVAGGYHWAVGYREHIIEFAAHTLDETDRTPRGQWLSRQRAAAAAEQDGLLDAVLFECFYGRTAGDSTLAVARELAGRNTGLDLVWAIADPSVRVPDGFRTVLMDSPEYIELLARAKYLVNNTNFPKYFRKNPGQTYLQTWHGTPLKRIGLDMRDQNLLSVAYMKMMEREADYWDFLISPSPYCTDIFPRAFGYDGEVLESGYPRNDILVSPGADEHRARVREQLGISPDARVLLYAPTWREHERVAGVPTKKLFLDPVELADRMPDVHVLIRGHANTAGASDASGAHPRVTDVTLFPQVELLYLASDELITDYSSVMFDFALLDRPVHLLVPDIETYRDRDRGFYFDIEAQPPGPVHRSPEELMRDLAGAAPDTSAQRREFRERFAPLDDGQAAKRVVDAVFGTADQVSDGSAP